MSRSPRLGSYVRGRTLIQTSPASFPPARSEWRRQQPAVGKVMRTLRIHYKKPWEAVPSDRWRNARPLTTRAYKVEFLSRLPVSRVGGAFNPERPSRAASASLAGTHHR